MKQSLFNPNENVDVEVIIGTRNEGHDIISTMHSLIFDLESSPYTWRILIIDNGSEDYSTKYLLETRDGLPSQRGLVTRGYVRVYYYPWLANVGCRDWAVRNVATAKYLVFSDAHIQVNPGSIASMIATMEKYNTSMVHASLDYWGSHHARQGVQYSIKFGEKGIYGTWTNMRAIDEPFWIGALGHAFFLIKRNEYIKIGGYNHYLREYGGGELSLSLSSWMIGNGSMVDLNAHVYHSMFGRGYNYNSIHLMHNYFLSTYLIGGEKYVGTALMAFYQQKGDAMKPYYKLLYDEALAEAQPHREFILKNSHHSFDEVIGTGKEPDCDGSCRTDKKGDSHFKRPWDRLNDYFFGKHLSFVREFELREDGGKVLIGNLEITDPDALNIYNDLKLNNLL